MNALLTALAMVMASVPATGEHFSGQAAHSVIRMESRGGVRCTGVVPELDSEGMADVSIHCSDGRTGLVKLRVDDEGIGIGYGSLQGHPMELTVLG